MRACVLTVRVCAYTAHGFACSLPTTAGLASTTQMTPIVQGGVDSDPMYVKYSSFAADQTAQRSAIQPSVIDTTAMSVGYAWPVRTGSACVCACVCVLGVRAHAWVCARVLGCVCVCVCAQRVWFCLCVCLCVRMRVLPRANVCGCARVQL